MLKWHDGYLRRLTKADTVRQRAINFMVLDVLPLSLSARHRARKWVHIIMIQHTFEYLYVLNISIERNPWLYISQSLCLAVYYSLSLFLLLDLSLIHMLNCFFSINEYNILAFFLLFLSRNLKRWGIFDSIPLETSFGVEPSSSSAGWKLPSQSFPRSWVAV